MSNLRKIISETLRNELNKTLILVEDVEISPELKYHIDNKLSLTDNIFRIYSTKYFNLVNEVRHLWESEKIKLNEEDTLMVESDLGKTIELDGDLIYLDAPFELEDPVNNISEAEYKGKKVDLNKPFRTSGQSKKFAVYVKTPKGNVKIVRFGDPNLKIKNKDKKAAKSFRARHKCDQKKDKTTAGYWSCNVGRYAKQLGLSSSNSW